MNIFLRKLYVKHKTLSITIISFLLTFIILALLLLSANIPRSDTTSYTSEVALSNSFINEKTFLGINTNNAIDAPADTLTYFKKIFEYNNSYKVDVLELNVHLTLDNKLILSSFPTLDTFSDAKAYIGETNIRPEKQTYEQLKRYNIAYNYKDTNGLYPYQNITDISQFCIMSLEEVFSYLETQVKNKWKSELLYIINIKSGDKSMEKATELLYQTCLGYNILKRTTLITPSGQIADYVDKKYPDMQRTATNSEVTAYYTSFIFGLDLSDDLPKYSSLLLPYHAFIVNFGKKTIIDYAHKYGISVMYNNINKINDIEYLSNIGADTIITAKPYSAYQII